MTHVVNNVFVKDPSAVDDYQWDWTEWLLAGEVISSATVTVPSGLTKISQTDTTTKITARLSGGTVRTRYVVVCHIATSLYREDDRSIFIQCDER